MFPTTNPNPKDLMMHQTQQGAQWREQPTGGSVAVTDSTLTIVDSKHAQSKNSLQGSRSVTPSQVARLAELETQIQQSVEAVDSFLTCLREIRDEKLFLIAHDSFEDYCRDRWGMTLRHFNRLIVHEEVKAELGPNGSQLNERQTRELSRIGQEYREGILKEVAAAGPVTAEAIRAKVDSLKPPAPFKNGREVVKTSDKKKGINMTGQLIRLADELKIMSDQCYAAFGVIMEAFKNA